MRPGDSSDSLVLQRKKIQSKVLSRRQRYIPISLLQMSNTRWARPFSNHLRMEIYARPYPNGEWPTFIETVNILAKSKDGMCHGITTQVVHQPVNSNAVASAYAQAHESMNRLFHNGGEDTLLAVDLVQVWISKHVLISTDVKKTILFARQRMFAARRKAIPHGIKRQTRTVTPYRRQKFCLCISRAYTTSKQRSRALQAKTTMSLHQRVNVKKPSRCPQQVCRADSCWWIV